MFLNLENMIYWVKSSRLNIENAVSCPQYLNLFPDWSIGFQCIITHWGKNSSVQALCEVMNDLLRTNVWKFKFSGSYHFFTQDTSLLYHSKKFQCFPQFSNVAPLHFPLFAGIWKSWKYVIIDNKKDDISPMYSTHGISLNTKQIWNRENIPI